MTTHDLDDRQPDLVQAARDAAALLDAQIAAARPAPDFAAMLARARALDPDAVPADPPPLAPVIPLARAGSDDAGALAPFTAALRGELDAKIAERRMASIPPLAAPGRKRTLAVALGVAFAAAAALLLVFVAPDRLGLRGGSSGVAANADVEPADALAAEPAGRPEQPVREDIRIIPALPPAREPEVAPVVDQPRPEPAPAPGRRPKKAAPKDMPEQTPAPAGPSLEDEAQALWERGELAAAERKYREIVDLAGKGQRAELAYGDIFALAKQIRGAEGQAAAWREYLQKFPAGRFADDARAGLCRRAAADERAACWQDYLDRHPRGSHRKQAEAALADREATP